MPTPAAAKVAACDAEGGIVAEAKGKERGRGVAGEEEEEEDEFVAVAALLEEEEEEEEEDKGGGVA